MEAAKFFRVKVARDEQQIAGVKTLWTEYWDALGLPVEFQGFGEQLNSLPGEFAYPPGLLLLATDDDELVGTIGLRKLREGACEAKRLYVRPAYRGRSYGHCLLATAVEYAQHMKYQDMFADTLPGMTAALKLYEGTSFQRCKPYSANPTPDAIYLWLPLWL